jgi:hypothetical protein
MDKDEFKKWYCYRSGITEEFFDEHFIILPCKCDSNECKGWATVNNNPFSIKIYNDLYNC